MKSKPILLQTQCQTLGRLIWVWLEGWPYFPYLAELGDFQRFFSTFWFCDDWHSVYAWCLFWLLQPVQNALNWFNYPSQQPLREYFKVCSFSYKWTSNFRLPKAMEAADPVQQSRLFSMVEAAIAASFLQTVRGMVRAHLWCVSSSDQGKSTIHFISDNTLKKKTKKGL